MRQFHSFRLDTVNHCLWRGESREVLTPKAFDVLRYLVEHAERLVTQEELLEALWPETYVNPEVIKKYILGIRKVLGDRHENPEFIRTFPRRGYQFIAPVSAVGAAESSALSVSAAKQLTIGESALERLGGNIGKALMSRQQCDADDRGFDCVRVRARRKPGMQAATMIGSLLANWREARCAAAMVFLLFVGVAEALPQNNDPEFNDSHFHLTNNIQEGPDIREFLKMMGNRAGRVAIFGIPLQQEWSYRVDGDRAPTYYLHSDAPLYYYSFTDAWIAMAYRSLTKEQRARFDPMITGFNPADMYAVDHIRRVLRTFPGVFSGIGEFTIHKEFVSAKIPAKWRACRIRR